MPGILLVVIVGLFVCQISLFATTIYLHRALSHRALALRPGTAVAFRVVIWITTGIRPRQWVAVHRKHHAFTDVEGDPHSPLIAGFSKVLLGNAWLYRKVARNKEDVERYARDISPDRLDRYLFDHALLGLGIGVGALIALFGPVIGSSIALVQTVLYLLAAAAINAVGHRYGKRPNPNTATNNRWLGILVAGEGLHNNHHARPTSAKLSFRTKEIDPAWWIIDLLHRRGWAEVKVERIPSLKDDVLANAERL